MSINELVRQPGMDLQKMELMERMLVMQERVMAQQAKIDFAAALARLQAKLPQIGKNGKIVVKGTERSKYARIEDIDLAIRPLLAEEGFSFSFDGESTDGKLFTISAKLQHNSGHSETKHYTLPVDTSEFRSVIQSIQSSRSFAKRNLICDHLNIVPRDEDDDGAGGSKPITQQQADDISVFVDEIKTDDRSMGRFLAYMGVSKCSEILARDHRKAINFLEEKRRKKNAGAK